MKIAFIVPYFGAFPSAFQLWLDSCAVNKDIDWLLFTDNHEPYLYPRNVHVYHVAFEELQAWFQTLLGFKIWLGKPYKLCDFRPLYGFLFSKYIRGYDYWGYCDIDLVWGDLQSFIQRSDLEEYGMLSGWGHCSLYRNTENINHLFECSTDALEECKKVLASNCNYLYDEVGIQKVVRKEGYRFAPLPLFDVRADKRKFYPTEATLPFMDRQLKKGLFKISGGKVILYGIDDTGEMFNQEFAYVHLAKRNMSVAVSSGNAGYLIVPNQYMPICEIDKKVIGKLVPRSDIYWHYQMTRIKSYMNIICGKNSVRWPGSRFQKVCDIVFHRRGSF